MVGKQLILHLSATECRPKDRTDHHEEPTDCGHKSKRNQEPAKCGVGTTRPEAGHERECKSGNADPEAHDAVFG